MGALQMRAEEGADRRRERERERERKKCITHDAALLEKTRTPITGQSYYANNHHGSHSNRAKDHACFWYLSDLTQTFTGKPPSL